MHPDRLTARYGLDPLPSGATELLEAIGEKRGCLNKRGIIDYDRVSRIFLNELRGGKLGLLTLETPRMMEQEKAELAILQAEKAELKSKDKQQRKAKFKAKQKQNRGR
jgi:ribosome biogenesis GTPase A